MIFLQHEFWDLRFFWVIFNRMDDFSFPSVIALLGLEKGVLRFYQNITIKVKSFLKVLFSSSWSCFTSSFFFGFLLYFSAHFLAINLYANVDLLDIFRYFAFAFPPFVLLTIISAITRTSQQVGYSVLIQDIGQPLLGLIFNDLICYDRA